MSLCYQFVWGTTNSGYKHCQTRKVFFKLRYRDHITNPNTARILEANHSNLPFTFFDSPLTRLNFISPSFKNPLCDFVHHSFKTPNPCPSPLVTESVFCCNKCPWQLLCHWRFGHIRASQLVGLLTCGHGWQSQLVYLQTSRRTMKNRNNKSRKMQRNCSISQMVYSISQYIWANVKYLFVCMYVCMHVCMYVWKYV